MIYRLLDPIEPLSIACCIPPLPKPIESRGPISRLLNCFGVLLTVEDPSGDQMTLELPAQIAKYIADEVPGILREMGTATKH